MLFASVMTRPDTRTAAVALQVFGATQEGGAHPGLRAADGRRAGLRGAGGRALPRLPALPGRRPDRGRSEVTTMWTLSGFADEIDRGLRDPVRGAAGLGLTLRRDPQRLGRQHPRPRRRPARDGAASCSPSTASRSPASARRSARSTSTRTSSRTSSGCGTPPTSRSCFGAPYIRIFSFFIRRGRRPRRPPRRGAPPDARARRRRRGRPTWSCCTRTRRTSTATSRDRCLDIVESVGSPNLRLAWDPANFVQVGVRPFTEGYAAAAPAPGLHPDQGRPRSPTATVVVAGEGDGEVRRDRPRAARRRLRRLLLPRAAPRRRTTRSAASPAPSCSPAPHAPSPTSCRHEGIAYA